MTASETKMPNSSEESVIKPITVIAASAGTGKTYTLSHEYLKGLDRTDSTSADSIQNPADPVHSSTDSIRNPADPAHSSCDSIRNPADPAHSSCDFIDRPAVKDPGIIATTFTKKAAHELLERIRRLLLEQGQWLAAQAVLSGYLGTVNALCGRLLSEYAIDAGLSPDLTVISEERLPAVFAIAVDTVIHEFADEMHGPATRLQLDNWRRDVATVIDCARNNNLDAGELEDLAEESWRTLSALLPIGSVADGAQLDEQLAAAIELALDQLPGPDDATQGTRSVIEKLKDVNLKVKSGAHIVWQSWADMSKLNVGKGSRQIIQPLVDAAQVYTKHPRLHEDIRTVIFGVFRCAAAAMQTYAEYKSEHGLIDFVDQELLTLNLLKKPEVRNSLKARTRLLLVDEFQDTSPIQLAIFLEIARIVDYSVWVGDEKQSIFGFRGSDPELMRKAVDFLIIESGGSREVLATSYRSRPKLVKFTNALFSQCSQLKQITSSSSIIDKVDRVELDAQNDPLHVWWLKGRRQENALASLAGGIAAILREPEKWLVLDRNTKELRPIKGSDIAILCTTNEHRWKTAKALVNEGLTVATERDSLLETPECVLACAALRVLVDDSDTLAIAEIANLLSPAKGAWLECLLSLDGRSWLERWLDGTDSGPTFNTASDTDTAPGTGNQESVDELSKTLQCLAHLRTMRTRSVDRTPSEVLEDAINGTGIMDTVLRWGKVRQRLANLDSLRGIARTYEDLCRSARIPATAAGLVVHLYKLVANGGNQPANPDDNGIHIITYHKSKGLEWPMVILCDLDRNIPSSPFGVKVESVDGNIDPLNPLKGRTIRYWPWPFGKQKSKINLKDQAMRTPQGRTAARRAVAENVRLLYVGMTRARDYLVLACRNTMHGTAWLKCLTDEQFDQPILTLSDQGVAYKADLIDGVPETIALFTPMDESQANEQAIDRGKDCYVPAGAKRSALIECQPYFLNPSTACESDFAIELQQPARTIVIGDRIPLYGNPDMLLVGDCVHAFLSIDTVSGDRRQRLDMASKVVAGFNIDHVKPEALLVMSDRLDEFLRKTYPGAEVRTEMPAVGKLANRRVRGTIDTIVETADGFIIIDHKTFPGRFEEWEARALTYAEQLALYRHVVEQATAKPVITQYIHMPVVGAMIEMHCKITPWGTEI